MSPKVEHLFSRPMAKGCWITMGAFCLAMMLGGDGCGWPRMPRRAKEPADSPAKEVSHTQTASRPTNNLSSGLQPSEVRLRKVDKAGFQSWLQSQKGKVVLVDYWATWCGPCRELFPHTVELHRQWASKGVVVAAVSMDDPDSEQEVRQFLAKQGAGFENFLAVGPPEPFEAFQITGGAIPYLQIYGADGKLFRELASAQQDLEPADIDNALQEALATLPPAGQPK